MRWRKNLPTIWRIKESYCYNNIKLRCSLISTPEKTNLHSQIYSHRLTPSANGRKLFVFKGILLRPLFSCLLQVHRVGHCTGYLSMNQTLVTSLHKYLWQLFWGVESSWRSLYLVRDNSNFSVMKFGQQDGEALVRIWRLFIFKRHSVVEVSTQMLKLERRQCRMTSLLHHHGSHITGTVTCVRPGVDLTSHWLSSDHHWPLSSRCS